MGQRWLVHYDIRQVCRQNMALWLDSILKTFWLVNGKIVDGSRPVAPRQFRASSRPPNWLDFWKCLIWLIYYYAATINIIHILGPDRSASASLAALWPLRMDDSFTTRVQEQHSAWAAELFANFVPQSLSLSLLTGFHYLMRNER